MQAWAVTIAFLVCACAAQADPSFASAKGIDGFITAGRLPVPEQPVLALGHATFADTCQNCHGGNKATGAPKVTSIKAWSKRIPQGMEVLVDHALTGFVGPTYTEMPARGANPDLTDAQVTAAVAYMVWISGGAEVAETFIMNQE